MPAIYSEAFVGDNRSKSAVLYLHGYPADKGVKNRDIAQRVFEQTYLDAFIIHYPGLGLSPGEFTFDQAVEASDRFAKRLLEEYPTLHLYGHSFGGLVAVELTKRNQSRIGRVCLASPLNILPSGDALRELSNFIYSQTSPLLSHLSQEDFFKNAELLAKEFSPRDSISSIDLSHREFLCIQAANDAEVPAATTSEFVRLFQSASLQYEVLDTDHSFMDCREVVGNLFGNFLSKGLPRKANP